jgi:hypothetical protein
MRGCGIDNVNDDGTTIGGVRLVAVYQRPATAFQRQVAGQLPASESELCIYDGTKMEPRQRAG